MATLNVPPPSTAQNSLQFEKVLPEIGVQGRAKLMPQHGKITMEAGPQQHQGRHTHQPQWRGFESADIIHITMPRGIINHHIHSYRLTPVGGRLPIFIHICEILTKETWVPTTVRGYLCQWPTQEAVPVTFMLDSKIFTYTYKQKALAEEISNLEVKGPTKHTWSVLYLWSPKTKEGGNKL